MIYQQKSHLEDDPRYQNSSTHPCDSGGHELKRWKQPLALMQGNVAYNKLLWYGLSSNPAHNWSFSAPDWLFSSTHPCDPGGHGFKPWKQPLALMQGNVADNKLLWFGLSLDPAHSWSFSALNLN
ncbi:hypothetical protein P3S68_029464 [Capsicum galapagoense]